MPALGFIFASIGEFKQLAMLSSASYLLIYLGVVLSVIKFRISRNRKKDHIIFREDILFLGLSAIVIFWVLSNLPLKELVSNGDFYSVTDRDLFHYKVSKI